MNQERVDLYRQVLAGIKIIKEHEVRWGIEIPEVPFRKIIAQLESYNLEEEEGLKISFVIIENARDKFFEEIKSRKSYYKKELENENEWKLKKKLKHRGELLDGLKELAKNLEDGLQMSEQTERGLVRAMADATMEKQKACGRMVNDRIQFLKDEISYYQRLKKSSKALWKRFVAW